MKNQPNKTKKKSAKSKVGDTNKTDIKKIDERLSKVENVAKTIQTELEYKQYDYRDTSGVYINSAVQVIPLTEKIEQGDGNDQRIADSIKMKAIQLHLGIDNPGATTAQVERIRIMLIMDHQANSAYPTNLDVFGITAPTVFDFTSRRSQKQDRFNILYDKVHLTESYNEAGVEGRYGKLNIKIYKRLNHKVNYYGDTAVVGSNGKNAIYLLFWGEANQYATLFTFARLTYLDD